MAKTKATFDTSKWAAMHPEVRPINALLPYARNANTHSDAQIRQLADSMREFGWTNPVLIDEDGMIIAGHGRVMAARLLGIAEIPVIIAHGWSDEQKRLFVLADNKIAANAEWNDEILLEELQALSDLEANVALSGYDAEEIEALTKLQNPDEPPASKKTKKKKIDIETEIWVLGPHKIVTGGGLDQGDLKWLIERWEERTGVEATRESDGATFGDVIASIGAPTEPQRRMAKGTEKKAVNETRTQGETDGAEGSRRKSRKAGAQQKRTQAAKRRR